MIESGNPGTISRHSPPGGSRAVIEAALEHVRLGQQAALAIVVDAQGSTYVRPGAAALFAGTLQVGWLSGGCLEAEIAERAGRAAESACIEWMEVDTRDDDAMFGGSALGCRGRLRLALLPLLAMPEWQALARHWLDRSGSMLFTLGAEGEIECAVGDLSCTWTLSTEALPWDAAGEGSTTWNVSIPTPPLAMVFGAGPEAPVLFPLLRAMGWLSTVVERRPRWLGAARSADRILETSPAHAVSELPARPPTAALVMHHSFELDLEALIALAQPAIPFVGLLGPHRRREDLFKLLPESARQSLAPRLRSPVGMDLGGRGPEAIALSIVAQLQSNLHGR
jgi:xanthine dehydrogenase accessory factor